MRRPADTRFNQQGLKSWMVQVDYAREMYLLLLIGVVLISLSSNLLAESNAAKSWIIDYDGGDATGDCSITEPGAGSSCQVAFSIDEDAEGPLFLYYQIDNFMQNNRRYVKSVSANQLKGQLIKDSYTAGLDCYPLISNGTKLLHPCGLQANSFFNDIISVNSAPNAASLDKSEIAYDYELESKYKQVDGFLTGIRGTNATCLETLPTVPSEADCGLYTDVNGVDHYYYYPNADTTQYLYESYPDIVNPIEGVTNVDFIVWMRLASLPNFRKYYGKIDTNVVSGDIISINITANYDVSSFNGVKSLYLTTGSENEFIYNQSIGNVMGIMGTLCLVAGSLLLGKKHFYPRSLKALRKGVTA
tara:strand:- start:708 stop:1787 length:1080 start_codon:yes stop_codon:yes gene_type:complete